MPTGPQAYENIPIVQLARRDKSKMLRFFSVKGNMLYRTQVELLATEPQSYRSILTSEAADDNKSKMQ